METKAPEGNLDKDTLCPICANISRTRDKGTCPHSAEDQEAYTAEREEQLRRTRLGHREKYCSEENQQAIAGWRAGLTKRKEMR